MPTPRCFARRLSRRPARRLSRRPARRLSHVCLPPRRPAVGGRATGPRRRARARCRLPNPCRQVAARRTLLTVRRAQGGSRNDWPRGDSLATRAATHSDPTLALPNQLGVSVKLCTPLCQSFFHLGRRGRVASESIVFSRLGGRSDARPDRPPPAPVLGCRHFAGGRPGEPEQGRRAPKLVRIRRPRPACGAMPNGIARRAGVRRRNSAGAAAFRDWPDSIF